MKKAEILLESIQLLQNEGKKPLKLPLSHYVLDYTLTTIFLSLYGYSIYWLITSLIWA